MTELTGKDETASANAEAAPITGEPAGKSTEKPERLPADEVPRAAAWLGYAGVVPFVAMAVIVFFLYPREEAVQVLHVQIAYGAVIASFLGGIRWALAMLFPEEPDLFRQLATASLPVVAAWITLFLPPAWGLLSLIGIFWGLAALDARLTRGGHAPVWYGGFRVRLTILVIAALGVSLAGMAVR